MQAGSNLNNDIVGVLLAGGKSTRMATDKALLPWRGQPLITYAAEILQQVFGKVVLAANDSARYEFLKLQCIADVHRDCGPLGGIHTALTHLKSRGIFVLACDTPFVSTDLVRYLTEQKTDASIIVPSFNGHLHPLCGLYTQRSLPTIMNQLQSGRYRVHDLFDLVPTAVVPITPDLPFYKENLFVNINSPEEFIC